MKQKKINAKNIPQGLPVTFSIVTVMALDYYGASGVVKGIAYTLLALIWVVALLDIFKHEYVDVFAEAESKKKPLHVV